MKPTDKMCPMMFRFSSKDLIGVELAPKCVGVCCAWYVTQTLCGEVFGECAMARTGLTLE